MKLLKEYIDKISTDLKMFNGFDLAKKNIFYLNENYKDILLEDLIRIEFNNLYPNIILGLYNEGLIDKKWESDIQQLKLFLDNVDELKKMITPEDHLVYKLGKTHANTFYSKIQTPSVVEYIHLVYSDIIKEYSENIVYIDVDMMLCKGDIDISKIPAKYEISKVEYFYIENKRRYITYVDGKLETKGHNAFTKEDLLELVKREIRQRRLNKLGL